MQKVLCERLCAGLLALTKNKEIIPSLKRKVKGDFKLLRYSLGSPINHPPGGAGDHLPQNSQWWQG